MSKNKQRIVSASKAVGATMVALSGFVPMPNLVNLTHGPVSNGPVASGQQSFAGLSGGAHAATLPVGVTGSARTGIVMTNAQSLKFGKIIATDVTGKVQLGTDGAVDSCSNCSHKGSQDEGAILGYSADVTATADITVSGLGVITLTGAGSSKVTLKGIRFEKVLDGAADQTITWGGAGTTGKLSNTNLDATGPIAAKFGGTLDWSGTTQPPLGTIPAATAVTIIINY